MSGNAQKPAEEWPLLGQLLDLAVVWIFLSNVQAFSNKSTSPVCSELTLPVCCQGIPDGFGGKGP